MVGGRSVVGGRYRVAAAQVERVAGGAAAQGSRWSGWHAVPVQQVDPMAAVAVAVGWHRARPTALPLA